MLKKPHWFMASVVAALTVVNPVSYPSLAALTITQKSIAASVLPGKEKSDPLKAPTCAPGVSLKAMKAGTWINVSDDKRMRKLEGADAAAFLATITDRSPVTKRFHKEAYEKAKAKGWKKASGPDGELLLLQFQKKATVAQQVEAPKGLLARVSNFFFPTVSAAQHVEGYVDDGMWWSDAYDDGNNANYEGVYGGYEYAYGNYSEGVIQFTLDGGGGATLDYSDGSLLYPGVEGGTFATPQGGYRRHIIGFLGCSLGGCVGFALGCAWVGPATMACAGLGCAATVIGCGVGTMFMAAVEYYDELGKQCRVNRNAC